MSRSLSVYPQTAEKTGSSVMSIRLLRPENRLTFRKLAHPREEAEPDVPVGVLDDPIDTAQEVAVRACYIRRVERIEDGLVVFVDQDRNGPSGLAVKGLDECREPLGTGAARRSHSRPAFHGVELRHEVREQ